MADTDAQQRIDAAADAGAFDETAYQGSFPPGWQDTALAPPPSLVDAPGVNPQTAFSDPEYLKREDDINKHLQALEDANAGLQSRYEASTEKMSDMVGGFAKDIEGNPPPTLEKSPEAPKERMADGMMAWMQAATVLSALAGGLARGNATVALTAFAGAVKGFTEGRREDFENHIEEWKAASQRVAADNKAKLDQYDLIMKNKKMTMDMKLSQMKIVSSMYGDEITYNLAQQKQYNELGLSLTKQQQFQANFEKQTELSNARIKNLEAHTQLLDQQREGLNQDALMQLVDRRLAGDKAAFANLGRGTQGGVTLQQANNLLAKVMKERGISGDDLAKIDQQYVGGTSYQRSAGTYASRVENATNEVAQLIPQALQASENLPRGKFVPFNQLKNLYLAGKSDPAYNDFMLSNFGLLSAYMRAMNPTGNPRVADRIETHAEGILSLATSPQAYRTQVNRLWMEVQQSKRATAQTREEPPSTFDPNAPIPPLPEGGIGNPAGDQSGWGQMTVH